MEKLSWLHHWVNDEGIESADEAMRVLRSSDRAARALIDLSKVHENTALSLDDPLPNGVVGNGRFDLSSFLTCGHIGCRRYTVDNLFATTWHYFDTIVVCGPMFVIAERPSDLECEAGRLNNDLELVFYLRNIGAEPHIAFISPKSLCPNHMYSHALDNVASEIELDYRRLYESIYNAGEVSVYENDDGDYVGYYTHHDLNMSPSLNLTTLGIKGQPTIHRATQALAKHITDIVAGRVLTDVDIARQLSVPLATAGELARLSLSTGANRREEQEVALNIPFPILDGLPTNELLRIMKDERPHYVRFRHAVREAVRIQVGEAESGDDPKAIGARIYTNHIEPELATLQRAMAIEKVSLKNRMALQVGVGVTPATVGMMADIALADGIGVGFALGLAAGSTVARKVVPELKEHIRGSTRLKEHDMYFLWQLHEHVR